MKVIGIEEIKKLNNDGNVYVIFPGAIKNEAQNYVGFFEATLVEGNIVDKGFKFDDNECFYTESNEVGFVIFNCNRFKYMNKFAILRLNLRISFGTMWLDDAIANFGEELEDF